MHFNQYASSRTVCVQLSRTYACEGMLILVFGQRGKYAGLLLQSRRLAIEVYCLLIVPVCVYVKMSERWIKEYDNSPMSP